MYPYGSSPRCPRCDKAVYAAEQVMGPGRRLFHKGCLTCADCNKRLDSLSLVEHDEEPYCKNCHRKNFGTRDLRQANLPHTPDLRPDLRPLSPTRTGSGEQNSTPFTPTRATAAPMALLRPTRALSPTRATFAPIGNFDAVPENEEVGQSGVKGREARDTDDEAEVSDILQFPPGTPSHNGASANGLPRSGQISPTRPRPVAKPVVAPPFDEDDEIADTVGGIKPMSEATPVSVLRPAPTATVTLGRRTGSPLTQTPTGTRYGATPLRATPTGGGRWGGGVTPQCPRCGKSVYFAEQVKAVGKTWHKACLRCEGCGTTLDATRLTEKDGVPHCHRCYNKLHGPAGHGYALLGKAGG